MPSHYGYWQDFCRDTGNRYSTVPVCNLFYESYTRNGTSATGFAHDGQIACDLLGISLSKDRHLTNLGSILLSFIAILVCLYLALKSNFKKAAVGRREIQLFLLSYAFVSLIEIFTVGGFPLSSAARRGFTAIHVAAVVVTAWILLINGVVGYQLVEDGTALSVGLIGISSVLVFIGSGYIALDHGFSFTGYFDSTLNAPNLSYSLYTLYLLVPLVFVCLFFISETYLVMRILGELTPLLYLFGAALFFAIGQIFQFVISVHICSGTGGKINGGMFEVLFTLLAVIMIWVFWESITEDDWPEGFP